VVSDYDKGFLSEEQINFLCSRARMSFLDTKKTLGGWARSAGIIKINEHEHKRSFDFIQSNPDLTIVETLGSRGASYRGRFFPTEAKDVIDVSGAGDTFLAALVSGFLTSGLLEDAIGVANAAAQKVVSARGVSLP
jgi:sugar/nucleoside kinase (ribokinase family)